MPIEVVLDNFIANFKNGLLRILVKCRAKNSIRYS